MRKPKILIVDDVYDNLSSLMDHLDLNGYKDIWNIITTDNSEEAKRILATSFEELYPVDVLLTDLVMEANDSGKVLILEANKIDPTIMTILFTANEQGVDRMSVFDYGTFEVIEKNIIGTTASEEIVLKTRRAIEIKSRISQINNMLKFFDPKAVSYLDKDTNNSKLNSKKLTIVFWDIRGFSNLCEILKEDPRSIGDFIKSYNSMASRIIGKHNGILDKFIGDGVMAIFGIDDDTLYGTYEAIKCAIELKEQFKNLLGKHIEEWASLTAQHIDVDLGCGIHTGNVLIGIVGDDYRNQFTALGGNVNLASRIEGQSKNGEILISQTTKTICNNMIFQEDFATIIDIKNIHGTFKVFKVNGLKQ